MCYQCPQENHIKKTLIVPLPYTKLFKPINQNWIKKRSELAFKYKNANPFPHICLESFLDKNTAKKAFNEFPIATNPIWSHNKYFNCRKLSTNKQEHFPKTIRNILDELNSEQFVSWLSKLVSIPNLRPDPELLGGVECIRLHQVVI